MNNEEQKYDNKLLVIGFLIGLVTFPQMTVLALIIYVVVGTFEKVKREIDEENKLK